MSAPVEAAQPFYLTVKRRFQDVKLEPGIDASEFCEACDAVIAFFDLFTNAPFALVRSDLASKIAKLRERLLVLPGGVTLEEMLEEERARKGTKAPNAITGAMTWLLRSLRFTSMGLRRNMSSDEEVSTSMTWAYGQSLKPYHGWAVRPIFTLAMKAVPYRQNFYLVLGEPTDVVMSELDLWLGGLERILGQMDGVYKREKYGSIDGKV